jgi:signal recognition particle receptor subunit beta
MSDTVNPLPSRAIRIVYCGPSESGKTTNLEALSRLLPSHSLHKLLQLATETQRTLSFDLLSLELAIGSDAPLRIELFTVPGQSFYLNARRRILREADGIVFVADSRRLRLEANIEALAEVAAAIEDSGRDVDDIPAVLQLNKCDDKTAVPRLELLSLLGCAGEPYVEAVASDGRGVVETLRLISRHVLAPRMQFEPTF